jgi:hypothetical protein
LIHITELATNNVKINKGLEKGNIHKMNCTIQQLLTKRKSALFDANRKWIHSKLARKEREREIDKKFN